MIAHIFGHSRVDFRKMPRRRALPLYLQTVMHPVDQQGQQHGQNDEHPDRADHRRRSALFRIGNKLLAHDYSREKRLTTQPSGMNCGSVMLRPSWRGRSIPPSERPSVQELSRSFRTA